MLIALAPVERFDGTPVLPHTVSERLSTPNRTWECRQPLCSQLAFKPARRNGNDACEFGIFYEHQLPKPWNDGDEEQLLNDAIEQVVLADELGIDHCVGGGAPLPRGVLPLLGARSVSGGLCGSTKNIRIGHGIKHTPANYNHPARVAEEIATLDLISRGRVEFGIGEGATRMELGGFGIPAKQKRAMSIEAGEQIANMMTMTPYPGYEGESFSCPVATCSQSPARNRTRLCGSRAPIAPRSSSPPSLGIGALAFTFVDPDEAAHWVKTYYDIIKSDRMRPHRPHGERQHRLGDRFLGARGPERGNPPRPRGFRVLSLRHQCHGDSRQRARSERISGRTSRPNGGRTPPRTIVAKGRPYGDDVLIRHRHAG